MANAARHGSLVRKQKELYAKCNRQSKPCWRQLQGFDTASAKPAREYFEQAKVEDFNAINYEAIDFARLSAEYLDKGELEQNIEFGNNLQGQKARLFSDIAVYEKRLQG